MYEGLTNHSCALQKIVYEQKNLFAKNIVRKAKKKKFIQFTIMTRCTNNVEHLQDEKCI